MRRDRTRFFGSAFFVSLVSVAVLGLMASATSAALAGGTGMATHGRMVQELFDSGVPHSQTAVLSALYGDTQEKLRQMLLHPKGLKQPSMEFRQARAAELIAQTRRMIQQLGTPTVQWTGEAIGRTYRESVRRADDQAKAAGVRESVIQGSFARVDSGTVEIFARHIVGDLNKAANGMLDTASRVLRQTAQIGMDEHSINSLLATGVIEGTPRETARALQAELERINEGKLVPVMTKGGVVMHYDARSYAETVTRTQTRKASVTSRHERLQQLDLDLVAIIGARSENPCTDFLGTVWSLSGNSTKWPSYDEIPGGGPPWHPNCSKSTRPFVEGLASKDQLAAADLNDDQRKLLGMDWSQLQRASRDLQIRQQRKGA